MVRDFAVFMAVMHRNMYVLKKRLLDYLINGFILVCMQVLLFGSFFPLLGMPADYSVPVYIGMCVTLMNSSAYTDGIRIIFDMAHDRFINYQITLPLSKSWFLASSIVTAVIQLCLVTLPLIMLGITLFGPRFGLQNAHWPAVITIYLLGLIFFSVVYLWLSFALSFTWFLDNFWPLIGTPIMVSGSTFFTWYKLYAFQPMLAILFLLNPVTYITEGLRTTLLGGPAYLPFWVCASVLAIWISLLFYAINSAIVKRLDPV